MKSEHQLVFLFICWNARFFERISLLTVIRRGTWQKLSLLLCWLMLLCQHTKNQFWILGLYQLCIVKQQYLACISCVQLNNNTWLVSAVCSQTTTFPEQDFGSWFWRVVLKINVCLACNELFHNYILLGCVQSLTQMVGNAHCDIISFHGLLYPVIHLYLSDHTDWVQWACACWLQTVPPGEQWYVHQQSVIVICWTDNNWKE